MSDLLSRCDAEASISGLTCCAGAVPQNSAQVLGLWTRLSLGYTTQAGHPKLLEQIASSYEAVAAKVTT